ncbi:MAG: hypothetical protein ACYTEQ_29650 [Planctomycetota bacterium]|jgi:hypothetical protein
MSEVQVQILDVNEIDTALIQQDEQNALALAEQELEKLLANDPNLLDMWGGENIEEGDTGQPPRLKIRQPTTDADDVPEGHFYNTLTGEHWEALEVVPVLPLGPTYIEYYRPFERGQSPFCASNDGVMPRESTDQRPLLDRKPGPCASCPQASWNGDEKPLCTRQRNFMLMIRETGEVLHLTWERSANKSAKQLTALMKSVGIRKSIFLTLKHTVNEKGKFYVPMASGGKKLDTKELLNVIEARAEVDRLVKSGAIQIVAEEDYDTPDGNGASHASDAGNMGEVDESDSIPF